MKLILFCAVASSLFLFSPAARAGLDVHHVWTMYHTSSGGWIKDVWNVTGSSSDPTISQMYVIADATASGGPRVDLGWQSFSAATTGTLVLGPYSDTALPAGSYTIYFNASVGPYADIQGNHQTYTYYGAGSAPGGSSYTPTTAQPDDLSIGIPGIGSISIPSGWCSQILTYAQEVAAAETGMSAAGLTSAFQTQLGLTADNLKQKAKDAQTELFVPQTSDQDQFKSKLAVFLNWGPYAFVQSFFAAVGTSGTGFTTPAPPDTSLPVGLLQSSAARSLTVTGQVVDTRPNDSTDTGSAPQTGVISFPLMIPASADGVVIGTGGTVTAVHAGQWYDTGERVPFDFTPFSGSPGFRYFRLLTGAGVFIMFGWMVAMRLWPKQVL